MDKLVRKIEIPLARQAIERAGLYIVQKKDIDRLAEVAADAIGIILGCAGVKRAEVDITVFIGEYRKVGLDAVAVLKLYLNDFGHNVVPRSVGGA